MKTLKQFKKEIVKITSIFLLGLAIFCGACNESKKSREEDYKKNSFDGEIKIDGSSTVYPITEAIEEQFQGTHENIKITIGISGTGGGFEKFCRGEIDINNASRQINQKEVDSCAAKNINYIPIQIAFDGLSIIANPQNDWIKYITVDELKKIWASEAEGKIKKWNQIRSEWPDEEIHLYGPGAESGTYDYFTEVIVGKNLSIRKDYIASEDDNVLVELIASDKDALGFFGFTYYEQNMDRLKLIPVDNGKGPVFPSIETVRNQTYTPLSRPLFIFINNNTIKKKEVKEFVHFFLDNVGTLAKEVGFIPLSEAKYKDEKKKFQEFLRMQK